MGGLEIGGHVAAIIGVEGSHLGLQVPKRIIAASLAARPLRCRVLVTSVPQWSLLSSFEHQASCTSETDYTPNKMARSGWSRRSDWRMARETPA